MGDILAGGSSSSGELSLDSGSGEESELWARSLVKSIRRVVRVGYSKHNSWSSCGASSFVTLKPVPSPTLYTKSV